MKRISLALASLVSSVILPCAIGEAQDAEPSKGNSVPYTQRSITLRKGMLRIDGGPADFTLLRHGRGFSLQKPPGADGGFGAAFGAVDAGAVDTTGGDFTFSGAAQTDIGGSGTSSGSADTGSDVGVYLGLGAAYGITDEIEAGVLAFPLYMTPDFDYGDIEAYGRYLLTQDEKMQVALQADIVLPTLTDFGLAAGVPILFRLDDKMQLQAAGQLRVTFADPDAVVGLFFPVALNFAVQDNIFVGAQTALSWLDLSASESIAIPLGFQGGLTGISNGMIDITGWFRFPSMIMPGAPEGADKFTLKVWTIGAGATVWMDTATM